MSSVPKSLFPPLCALIFDMDGTLYRSHKLNQRYDQSLYDFLAKKKGLSRCQAEVLFKQTYCRLEKRFKRLPSKLYTLTQLGISDYEWATEHGARVCPESVLHPNQRLKNVLMNLREKFRLALLTNNHYQNTRATLKALDIADLFDQILTLSDSRLFKPSTRLYKKMAKYLRVEPEKCLSIGDRYDLDLAPAAAVGMQTLLVQKMQDIYQLPKVLQPAQAHYLMWETLMQKRLAIRTTVKVLKQGKLAIIPTDTVYGLAAIPEEIAVSWIYRAKGRHECNPLALLLADRAEVQKYVQVSARAQAIMNTYWPGAVTLVLPTKKGTPWGRITRGGHTLAVRIPDHDLARQIIRQAGGALATTSANYSGQASPASVEAIDKRVLAFAEVLINSGETKIKQHSTVVKVTGRKVEVLRQGSVKL